MLRRDLPSLVCGAVLGIGCRSEPAARQPEALATVPVPGTAATPPVPPREAVAGAGSAPASAGTLSLPSGLAFSCQSESQCLAHRCNLAVGKCVWPCQTDNDCQPGFTCLPPACLPRLGN